ncbi:hypothetical protein FrEUN1fDRAFT_8097 [Parafrankia sp. EUN1f]|nr:hypothetical protein FrEUN1fDRAFT_8097 [Parafrankia sp. EUN1f]
MVLAVVLVVLLAGGLAGLGVVLTSGPDGTAGPTAATPGTAATLGGRAGTDSATDAGSGTTTPGRSPASASATTGATVTPTVPAGSGGAVALDQVGTVIPSSTDPVQAPAGLTSRSGVAGWSVAVPAGWRSAGRAPTKETFAAAEGFPELLVEVRPTAGPSAIGAWQELEAGVARDSPDYRRVSIRPADGADGTSAAIWEFTSTSRGRTVRTVDVAVVRNGHGYAMRWRVPEDQWPQHEQLVRQVTATFRPGP